jgi:DNA-binding transcriptional MerR regulator
MTTVQSDQEMTIRQMCDRFGVTARALRFYESKEMLSPRRDGQRRFYGARDRARLTLILRGKRYGLALEDIRRLLDLYSADDRGLAQLRAVREVAVVRRAALEAERAELDAKLVELGELIASGDAWIAEAEAARAA